MCECNAWEVARGGERGMYRLGKGGGEKGVAAGTRASGSNGSPVDKSLGFDGLETKL